MRVESELLFLSCSGPMYLSVPIKEETWRDRLCSPLSRDDTVGAALIVPPVAAAAKAFHGRARPERPHPPIRAHHGALALGADRRECASFADQVRNRRVTDDFVSLALSPALWGWVPKSEKRR